MIGRTSRTTSNFFTGRVTGVDLSVVYGPVICTLIQFSNRNASGMQVIVSDRVDSNGTAYGKSRHEPLHPAADDADRRPHLGAVFSGHQVTPVA